MTVEGETTMTTTRTFSFTLGLGAALLVSLGLSACGEAMPMATFETEGWIDTMPPNAPGSHPGFADQGEGEEEWEDEDDEGEEEGGDFSGWALWGAYENGQLTDPVAEYYAEVGGQEMCSMLIEIPSVQPLDSCAECTNAWEFQFGAAEEEINVDGACQDPGPGDVSGTTIRLGWAGDVAFLEVDGSWVEAGEAFLEDGELGIEWGTSE